MEYEKSASGSVYLIKSDKGYWLPGGFGYTSNKAEAGAHLSAEERQAVADGLLIQPLIGSLPNIMAPEWFDGLKRAAEGRRLMVLDTLRRFHIEEENASGPMGIPFRPEHPYDTHARLLLL
nr:helicase RepA family protein [Akkermansia muciniphila]